MAVDRQCCAVPQALGQIDPVAERHGGNTQIIWAMDEATLRRRIAEERLWRPWRAFNPVYSDTPLDAFGLPELIEIELIHTCNLRCVMCHVSYETLTKQQLDPRFLDNLHGLEGKWAKLGSSYEPVAHPQFDKIARGLTERGMTIDLITNGTLFTPPLIERIKDCSFGNVAISFDGIRPATYEHIRRRADFKTAIERIRAFKDAVKEHNPDCRFQINYTVVNSNIDEIGEAVDFWEQEGFDHLGFIAMVKRDEDPIVQEESIEARLDDLTRQLHEAARKVVRGGYRLTLSSPQFRDPALMAEFPGKVGLGGAGIVASGHRGARFPVSPSTYFQNGDFPGMPVSCRSPFKFARISYDGQIYLCHLFSIGSIYDGDLLTLWEGEAAERIRELVRRDARTCHSCDYFRFCIKSNEVDYGRADSFVASSGFSEVGKTWYYRFWRWRGTYYAVPRGHGVSGGDLVDPLRCAKMGILSAAEFDDLRRRAARTAPKLRVALSGALNAMLHKVSPSDDHLARPIAPKRGAVSVGNSWLYRYWHWNGRYYAAPRDTLSELFDLAHPGNSRGRSILVADSLEALRAQAKRRWPGSRAILVGTLRTVAARLRPDAFKRQDPSPGAPAGFDHGS